VLVWTGDYDMRTGVAQIIDQRATAAMRATTDAGGYVV
jgi:hypothetical protein